MSGQKAHVDDQPCTHANAVEGLCPTCQSSLGQYVVVTASALFGTRR